MPGTNETPSPLELPGIFKDLVLHADLDACFAGRSPARALKVWGTCQHLMAWQELENVTFLSDRSPSGGS